MIKAIVYDCFGVLVKEWLAVLAEPYPEKVRQQLWDAVKASNMGFIDYKEGIQQMADVLGITPEALQQARKENEIKNIVLLEHIDVLRNQGYKTAILSNVSAGGITRRFTDHELTTLFDAVVESGAVGFTKPDAKAYEYVAGQVGFEVSECIMIDDREDFCAGAEMAGMSSLLYSDFATYKKELEQLLA